MEPGTPPVPPRYCNFAEWIHTSMHPAQTCLVCGGNRSIEIGRHEFQPTCETGNDADYVQSRLAVVFSQWAPKSTSLLLKYVLCEGCGFVWYQPRPTAADIDAKYRHLSSLNAPRGKRDRGVELLRASELERTIRKVFRTHRGDEESSPRLLDFGGGDGRLVSGLGDIVREICVVDYDPSTVTGVRRLGQTLEDLNEDERFELIVASHVVEHLADPVGVLSQLRRQAASEGMIYVEVPMEIWGRPPIHREPVTHVNFFVESSLATALEKAGWTVDRCWMAMASHSASGRIPVVAAVARNVAGVAPAVTPRGAGQTLRRLAPNITERLKWLWLRPDRAVDFALRSIRLR